MTDDKKIKIFNGKRVRTHWDADEERWLFSIVDVVAVLTESVDPFVYWRKLKQRLLEEGNETVTNCHALKMYQTFINTYGLIKLLIIFGKERRLVERRDGKPLPFIISRCL